MSFYACFLSWIRFPFMYVCISFYLIGKLLCIYFLGCASEWSEISCMCFMCIYWLAYVTLMLYVFNSFIFVFYLNRIIAILSWCFSFVQNRLYIKFILFYSLQIPNQFLISVLDIATAQPASKHADIFLFHADTFLFLRLPISWLCRYLSQHRFENAVTLLFAENAWRVFTENCDFHLQLHLDVDVCIMAMNEWPKFEQKWGDINTDIGGRSCLADESSAILRDVYLAVTPSHTPPCINDIQ